MADTKQTKPTDQFLNRSGLEELSTSIKTHVHRKAELQENIDVRNPRVYVEGWENGDVIDSSVFRTLDDVMNFMFDNTKPEQNPDGSCVLPTMTLGGDEKVVQEVRTIATFRPRHKTFDAGKIRTCAEPWYGEMFCISVPSGSTLASPPNYMIANCGQTTEVPQFALWAQEDDVVETVTVQHGTQYTNYYRGTCDYNESTALSYTTHGKLVEILGVTYFDSGTTEPSPAIRKEIVGYYPSFGTAAAGDDMKVNDGSPSIGSGANTYSTIQKYGNYLNIPGEFYIKVNAENVAQWVLYYHASLTFSGCEKYDPTLKKTYTGQSNSSFTEYTGYKVHCNGNATEVITNEEYEAGIADGTLVDDGNWENYKKLTITNSDDFDSTSCARKIILV